MSKLGGLRFTRNYICMLDLQDTTTVQKIGYKLLIVMASLCSGWYNLTEALPKISLQSPNLFDRVYPRTAVSSCLRFHYLVHVMLYPELALMNERA